MASGNLFTVNGTVFLLGTDGHNIKIANSSDNGYTWNSSILSPPPRNGSYATGILPCQATYLQRCTNMLELAGAMPTLHAQGRYWRAMEVFTQPQKWPIDFQAMVLSAPEGCDLTDSSCWTISPPLPFNNSWVPKDWAMPELPGWR